MENVRPAPLPSPWIVAPLATALALWVLPVINTDLREALVPWLGILVVKGPIAAFATPFSDYMPFYLYLLALVSPLGHVVGSVALVKSVAIAGMIALMLAVRQLLLATGAAQPTRGAALITVLPSVVLNASLLGQIDAWWTAAVVMALAQAQRRRHGAMLLCYGVALGIKLQTILAAPIILVLLLSRRVPVRWWALAGVGFLATILPAYAAGWPLGNLLTIYTRQTGMFPYISMDAPNIWLIARGFAGPVTPGLTALAMVMAVGTSAAFVAWGSTRRWQGRDLIAAALLCTLMTAGLLPRMHERYFFLADVLALTLALVRRDREGWWIAGLVQAGSCLALLAYFADTPQFAVAGVVPMLWATLRVARPLLMPAVNDNSPLSESWLPVDGAWSAAPALTSPRSEEDSFG